MRIDEIETRKAEINALLNTDAELDIDALTEEVRSLNEEAEKIKAAAAKEAELRNAVAPAVVAEIIEKEKKEVRKMENLEIRNTPEYIDAFARYIKTEDATECRGLLSENASGTVAVPEMVYDIIKTAWDEEGVMSLVKKTYIKGNLKVGFEYGADAAVVHTEGSAAVSEETLTLGIVELVPKSIKKWISLSDEALDLSGEAFLNYIYRELAYQIAKKAADELVGKIVAASTASSASAVGVPVYTAASITLGTIASALSELSDECANPVIIMNKKTYAAFKAVQYAGNYNVDPFEGLPVVYNNSLSAFSAATTGVCYAIVGDLGHGAIANFPNGEEITFKYDDVSLATSDLVKVIGREFVGLGVVAPKAFCKVIH